MIVMILEKVPIGLRGELSRWLVEPHAGLFIGHVSARVRDKLWEKCTKAKGAGAVLQIWSTNNEQRFAMRAFGDPTRRIVEWEGVQLIEIPHDLEAQAGGSVKLKRLKGLRASATSG